MKLPRVLYLDDDSDTALQIAMALQDNVSMDLAADAETAFRMCARVKYDFIVTDHYLGEDSETGLSFVARIRRLTDVAATRPDVRIVAFTGDPLGYRRNEYRELGALFVPKPCSTSTLASIFSDFDAARAEFEARRLDHTNGDSAKGSLD